MEAPWLSIVCKRFWEANESGWFFRTKKRNMYCSAPELRGYELEAPKQSQVIITRCKFLGASFSNFLRGAGLSHLTNVWLEGNKYQTDLQDKNSRSSKLGGREGYPQHFVASSWAEQPWSFHTEEDETPKPLPGRLFIRYKADLGLQSNFKMPSDSIKYPHDHPVYGMFLLGFSHQISPS